MITGGWVEVVAAIVIWGGGRCAWDDASASTSCVISPPSVGRRGMVLG